MNLIINSLNTCIWLILTSLTLKCLSQQNNKGNKITAGQVPKAPAVTAPLSLNGEQNQFSLDSLLSLCSTMLGFQCKHISHFYFGGMRYHLMSLLPKTSTDDSLDESDKTRVVDLTPIIRCMGTVEDKCRGKLDNTLQCKWCDLTSKAGYKKEDLDGDTGVCLVTSAEDTFVTTCSEYALATQREIKKSVNPRKPPSEMQVKNCLQHGFDCLNLSDGCKCEDNPECSTLKVDEKLYLGGLKNKEVVPLTDVCFPKTYTEVWGPKVSLDANENIPSSGTTVTTTGTLLATTTSTTSREHQVYHRLFSIFFTISLAYIIVEDYLVL